MNTRYFACLDCKQYISAGYRWCYGYLEEPGHLEMNAPFVADIVLEAATYWDTQADGHEPAEWLEKLLPQVRVFLLQHRSHRLFLGDPEHIYLEDELRYEFLEWDDVGDGEPFDVSMKTLYTILACRSWIDVEKYMESREREVWWWGQLGIMEHAKTRFEEFAAEHGPS